MGRPVHPHIITPDSALGGKDIVRSLRFDDSDSHRLTRTIGSTGNRRTYTFSWWLKRTMKSSEQYVWYNGNASSAPYLDARFEANGHQLQLSDYTGGSSRPIRLITNRQFRDCNSWYHFVFAVDTTQSTSSNRAKLYVNGVQETSFSTETYPSQNYESSANVSSGIQVWGTNRTSTSNDLDGYLADVHFVDGAALNPLVFGYTEPLTGIWRPKRFKFATDIPNKTTRTYSGTVTASGNGFGSAPFTRFFDGDITSFFNNSAGGQIITWDCSSYGLSGNVRIYGRGSAYDVYINGNATKVADMPSSNGWVDLGTHEKINEIQWAGTTYNTNNGLGSAGVYASMIMVNGVLLRDNMSEFGTNGYHLDFSDNSSTTAATLGKDTSGNGNNFTPNNFGGTNVDAVLDTPINNFITLNPLRRGGDNCTLSDGNLKATGPNQTFPGATANIALSSGKWYYEFVINTKASAPMCGVCKNNYVSGGAGRILYRSGGHYVMADGSEPSTPDAYGVGDIIGVAIDLDDATGNIRFYKNGTLQTVHANLNGIKSSLSISTLGGLVPYVQMYHNDVCTVNFGQTPFTHTPPTGFRALSYKNLTTPIGDSIVDPRDHFDTLLYTGNGSNKTVTGLQFKPDFAWIKSLSSAHHPSWTDSVRGMLKTLSSTINNLGEYTESAGLNKFLHNGLGFNGNNYYSVNVNGDNFVAWCWKGGGSSGTHNIDGVGYATAAAAGLNGGTITPTGTSINTISGLSIIAYTGNGTNGASMSHGLPSAPKIMFHRSRGQARNWYTITTAIDGSADYWYLNSTAAPNNSAVTAPTSDLIYFTSSQESNNNGENYIVYAFCEIPGYSKIGIYRGNGDNNGTYVPLGFRPGWVMIRKSSGTEDWVIYDNKRDVDNIVGFRIYADIANAAGSNASDLDFLSDGFKHRKSTGLTNDNQTYFYMAFAEQPGDTPYMAPTNAR